MQNKLINGQSPHLIKSLITGTPVDATRWWSALWELMPWCLMHQVISIHNADLLTICTQSVS